MAIKIYEKFAPRANPADGDYPYGSLKNESVPGAKDGTPLDAAWGNDYAGFDAALLDEAGIVPNGLADTVGSSQRLDAIKKIISSSSGLVFDNVADMALESVTVGTSCVTVSYYGGYAATLGGPTGGAGYIVVTKSEHDVMRGYSTVDENIDHTLQNGNVAILLSQYARYMSCHGASSFTSDANNTAAINAAIRYGAAFKSDIYVDGKYNFDGQLTIKTFSTIKGFGSDNSALVYTGNPALFAVTTDGGVAQRVTLENFALAGESGIYNKKLFNAVGLRYSSVTDVDIYNAETCMAIDLSWGTTFTRCSFKSGGDSGVTPIGSTGIDMVLGALNALAFSGCVVSFNEVAVNAGGAGRNVVFDGACTFESNATVFRFIGAGSSKGFIVRDSYFEANTTHHFYIDNGFGARDDQILIENNYFDITPGIQAGVVTIGQIGTGTSTLVLRDNYIEQLVANSNPVNPYIIHATVLTTNFNITYESNNNIRVIGAGAVKIGHINWENVDFRMFSSNIPYEPAYTNGFAAENASSNIRIFVRNGTARATGSAVNPANVAIGQVNIVTIPFYLSAQTPVYPTLATSGSGSAELSQITGTAISVDMTGAPTDPVYVDASWPLQGGVYL